jgi:hypothetical protein
MGITIRLLTPELAGDSGPVRLYEKAGFVKVSVSGSKLFMRKEL